MNHVISTRFFDAVNYAAIAHDNQIYASRIISKVGHSYSVAMILSDYGLDEDTVIAGVLHNIITGSEFPRIDYIQERFGKTVADYITDITGEDKNTDWQDRKESQIYRLKHSCFNSKCLCTADKIHELIILNSGLSDAYILSYSSVNLPMEKITWYYSKMYNILNTSKIINLGILEEYKKQLDILIKRVN